MYVGSLSPISNRADFSGIFQTEDGDTGELIDLTGASVVFEIRNRNNGLSVISATTSGGSVSIIDTGTIQVSITRNQLSVLCADTYDVGCTVTTADGTIYQLIIGALPILDGIVTQ